MALSLEQQKAIALAKARQRQAQAQQVTQPQPDQPRRAGTDIDEAILTMASGAIAEPLAGLAGIVQSVNPFADEALVRELLKLLARH